MAEKTEVEANKTEHTKESRQKIIEILERCEGRSRTEVLKNASKLTASDRLKLIYYFEIDPKKLADTIVMFRLTPSKGHPVSTPSDNPDLLAGV